MKESAAIEVITPARATEILKVLEERIAKGEVTQRTLNERTVERYANDMKQGHWLTNNQGIGFDENDQPYDGRHRLWAIVKAGVPVKMLVYRGPAEASSNGIALRLVDTVDCGRHRSLSQQLAIDGVKNANTIAGCIRCIAILATNDDRRISLASARALMNMYHSEIKRVIEGFHADPRLMRGNVMAPLAVYRKFNRAKADEFIEGYQSMANLPHNSPILSLRRYMANHPGHGARDVWWKLRATCLAIYYFDSGKLLTLIKRTDIGLDWMKQEAAGAIRRINNIIGTNPTDGE